MLLPSIFGENLFDDMFDFPKFDWDNIDKKLCERKVSRMMKTDVHEYDDRYDIDIDLPGFKKEEIGISLNDGYLSVSAGKEENKEEKDSDGKVIKQERYCGAMQRSFYVGDKISEEDIKAKYENGVLKLCVSKKEEEKLPEKKMIAIE